jgi:PIN domain nuclease of toxin-antitoxin system
VIICDTHVLVFDGLVPSRLSAKARRLLKEGEESAQLACADISLWEIAMLIARGRIKVGAGPEDFIQALLDARGYRVQPITAEIAARSQSAEITHRDPADRLIAATALVGDSDLLSADAAMRGVPGLRVVW